MKEKQEDRIETISILDWKNGLGIEIGFCNISHKALFSVSAVDYNGKKKNRITATVPLKEPVSFHETYCTYSGDDFTVTLVKHPSKYHAVFSAPMLEFLPGKKGVKGELVLPDFESNTFTQEKDGWHLSCTSPLSVDGMLFLNHKGLQMDRDNAIGSFSSLSGDFRGKELSWIFATIAGSDNQAWGFVGQDGNGICMRNGKTYKTDPHFEPMFSLQEKFPKGYVKSEYLHISGNIKAGTGIGIKPGYAIRTSFLI